MWLDIFGKLYDERRAVKVNGTKVWKSEIIFFIPLKNYRQRKLRNFTTDNLLLRFPESNEIF